MSNWKLQYSQAYQDMDAHCSSLLHSTVLHNPSHHAVVDHILCFLFLCHFHKVNCSHSILSTLSTLHPLVTTKLIDDKSYHAHKIYRSHILLPILHMKSILFKVVLVNFEIMDQNGHSYQDKVLHCSSVHHASLLDNPCHHTEVVYTLLCDAESHFHKFQNNWTSQTIVSRPHQL